MRGVRGERHGPPSAGGAWVAAHVRTSIIKHVAHVRDAGGVPVQGLVEGERELPRVASRAHGAGRGLRAAGGGRRQKRLRRTQHAGGRARDCRVARGAREAAHGKHPLHGRDARGVPALQRLVELPRALPRVASRAHGAGRDASRAYAQRAGGEAATAGWRAGRGEQRT